MNDNHAIDTREKKLFLTSVTCFLCLFSANCRRFLSSVTFANGKQSTLVKAQMLGPELRDGCGLEIFGNLGNVFKSKEDAKRKNARLHSANFRHRHRLEEITLIMKWKERYINE